MNVILETCIGPIPSDVSEENLRKMAADRERYLVVREPLDFGDGEIHVYERSFNTELFLKTPPTKELIEAQREPMRQPIVHTGWPRWPQRTPK